MSIPRRNRYTPIKARVKYRLRRDLVHAAGCSYDTCVHRSPEVLAEFLTEAVVLGVRIPRSLRKLARQILERFGIERLSMATRSRLGNL